LLLGAGCKFDPENPAYRQTGNETRYTIYRLPYKPLTRERALLFRKGLAFAGEQSVCVGRALTR
jgi:hypothetical protein